MNCSHASRGSILQFSRFLCQCKSTVCAYSRVAMSVETKRNFVLWTCKVRITLLPTYIFRKTFVVLFILNLVAYLGLFVIRRLCIYWTPNSLFLRDLAQYPVNMDWFSKHVTDFATHWKLIELSFWKDCLVLWYKIGQYRSVCDYLWVAWLMFMAGVFQLERMLWMPSID